MLKPPRQGSFGQLHTRTHYAHQDTCVLASLGQADLAELRRKRPECNWGPCREGTMPAEPSHTMP